MSVERALAEIAAARKQIESEAAHKLAALDEAEAALRSIEKAKAPTPRPPRESRGRSRKASPRRRRSPAPSSEPPERQAKARSREAGLEKRVALVAFIRNHPGCSQAEIRKALDLSAGECSRMVKRLVSDGKLRKEGERSAQRLWTGEAPLMPEDASGAKTGLERRIVEAIGEGSISAAEVARLAHCSINDAKSVLGGLVNRRVLTRVGSGGAAFYSRVARPRTMGEDEAEAALSALGNGAGS